MNLKFKITASYFGSQEILTVAHVPLGTPFFHFNNILNKIETKGLWQNSSQQFFQQIMFQCLLKHLNTIFLTHLNWFLPQIYTVKNWQIILLPQSARWELRGQMASNYPDLALPLFPVALTSLSLSPQMEFWNSKLCKQYFTLIPWFFH